VAPGGEEDSVGQTLHVSGSLGVWQRLALRDLRKAIFAATT